MSVLQPDSEIEMEPPISVPVQMYHQPPIILPHIAQKMKSCPLIGFGITLFILSAATLGLGGWAVSFSVNSNYAYASLGCSGFFLLTSFFCMYGGNDIGNRKCSIVTALVFGILGVIVGVVGIFTTIIACRWYGANCNLCHAEVSLEDLSISCATTCFKAYLPVYIGLAALTFLQAIIGLILSCSACCNVCSCCCCYKEPMTNGFIIQPAPVTTYIQNAQGRGPPPYKRLQEVDNADIYRQQNYNPQY